MSFNGNAYGDDPVTDAEIIVEGTRDTASVYGEMYFWGEVAAFGEVKGVGIYLPTGLGAPKSGGGDTPDESDVPCIDAVEDAEKFADLLSDAMSQGDAGVKREATREMASLYVADQKGPGWKGPVWVDNLQNIVLWGEIDGKFGVDKNGGPKKGMEINKITEGVWNLLVALREVEDECED